MTDAAVEGGEKPVAVCVREADDGSVSVEIAGQADATAVTDQVNRILSLDVDGRGFPEVGRRDPVVGKLQDAHRGLRPVCFFSPYEAAAWVIISHRIRIGQAALDGSLAAERLRAMPCEQAVSELRALPGIGPFSAELVLLRGAGAPDCLALHEPRLRQATSMAYGWSREPSDKELSALAEPWRPYRTWVCVLLRVMLQERQARPN